jgi:hypothetical protein
MTKLSADEMRVSEAQAKLKVTRAARTAFEQAAVFRQYARAVNSAEPRKLEGYTWSFTGFVEKSKAKAEAEAATTQANDAHTAFVDEINDLKRILVGETELDKLLGPAQLDEDRAAEKFAELEARFSEEREKIDALQTKRKAVVKVLMELKNVERRLWIYVLGWKGNADLMTLVTGDWRSQLPARPRSRVPRPPRPPANKKKDLSELVKPGAIAKLRSGLREEAGDGTAFTADAIKELLGEEIVKELTDKDALNLRRPVEQLTDTQKRLEVLTQLGLDSDLQLVVLAKLGLVGEAEKEELEKLLGDAVVKELTDQPQEKRTEILKGKIIGLTSEFAGEIVEKLALP